MTRVRTPRRRASSQEDFVKKKLIVALAAGLAAAVAVVAVSIVRASEPDAPEATGGVVATFTVAGETFRVKFTKAADIAVARDVLAGKATPVPFPIGDIVYGSPDVNTGYTWHLESVAWTEMAMEVCDGRPRSDVETHQLTSSNYCPWGAKLISLT
jgi:hypothetical protein